MHMFSARYRGQVQSILIHKDMTVPEFLEALSYSLSLPDGVIVGFQDRTGLIITPSYVVHNPQELRNETYDMMLKSGTATSIAQTNQVPFMHQHQSSYVQDQTAQNYQQPMRQNFMNEGSSYLSGGYAQQNLIGDRTVPIGNFQNIPPVLSQEDEMTQIILLVRALPIDTLFTENLKSKVVAKIRQKDNGILGAYQLYLNDGDIEGFKARIIHRALSPNISECPSSATTANFNLSFSRTSTAGGIRPNTRENSRIRGYQTALAQDRFLPVVLELESKNLLDEQTAGLVKTFILEENVEIFKVINSYIARAINEQELSFRLQRLAQQLGTYIERPQSPLPKKKNQLLNYVNSLARFHFNDQDDIQLLNKLIQEENEFVLSCFDVFESDKDHDNLIDSLHRILEKSKQMGLHLQSVTTSSFYNQQPWPRSQQMTPNEPRQPGSTQGSVASQPQPYISKWDERRYNVGQNPTMNQQQVTPSTERPSGAVGGRRQVPTGPGYPLPQFQQTTVHNVALIPNYFSSGEEENQATIINPRDRLYSGNKSGIKEEAIRTRDYEQVRESEKSQKSQGSKSQKRKYKNRKDIESSSDEEESSESEDKRSKKKSKSNKKGRQHQKKSKSKKRRDTNNSDDLSENSDDCSKESFRGYQRKKKRQDSSEESSSDKSDDSYRKSTSKKSHKSKKDKERLLKKEKSKDQRGKSKSRKELISDDKIKQVLLDEDAKVALRIENYAVLKYLIKVKDNDIQNIIQQFLENESSEYLINSLEGKTEDTLIFMLQKNFSNEQLAQLRQLRISRNKGYLKSFKKLKKKLNIDKLIKKLKKLLEKHILEEVKPAIIRQQTQKEKLISAFQMILYGEYIGNDKGTYLQEQFETENQELYKILEGFTKHNNYLNLKNSIAEFLLKNFKSAQPKQEFNNLKQAIEVLLKRGELAQHDAEILKVLYQKNDKHLNAAWEAFTVIKNTEDFADTLAVLCDVKRELQQNEKTNAYSKAPIQEEKTKKSYQQNASSSSSNQSREIQTPTKNGTQGQTTNPMPQFSLIRLNQTNSSHEEKIDDKKRIISEEDEGKLQINDNPDDSDNNEDINSIIEYQHKILRKYTMMGMIQYADAPFFHNMVDQRDYKMISIFEVFAINRNEDDFLENLGLFADLASDQDEENEALEGYDDINDSEEQNSFFQNKEEITDPKLKLLYDFKTSLTEEEFKWCKDQYAKNNKNLMMTIEVFIITKDQNDFVHSIKKIYQLDKK